MITSTKILQTNTSNNDDGNNDGSNLNVFHILIFRMSITLLGSIIYLYIYKIPYSPWGKFEFKKLMVLRGFFGTFGVLGVYYPLKYLTVSNCILITFLTPSLTSILSYLLINQPFNIYHLINCLISLFGVILITNPFNDNQISNNNKLTNGSSLEKLSALIVGLIGVFGTALVFIIIKKLGEEVNPIQTMVYFALVSLIFSIGMNGIVLKDYIFPQNLTFEQILLLSGIGLFGFLMQILFTQALRIKSGNPNTVSMIMYIQIVYSILWEWLIWKQFPNKLTWIGIIIILSGSIATIYINNIPKDHHDEDEEDLELEHVIIHQDHNSK
ncbi:hypothetical protein WICMUC_005571 [Wickerhamomyces mucosus]|uniref:EamA domain-containing protein n=1 Tax=Wickerhamomyces mucosus TaxID=1378264 RepID=A0A9P8P768_9ASCO|nr:hypothetical protein WICMUC_005571 [Wickerhamomyces mucosus]